MNAQDWHDLVTCIPTQDGQKTPLDQIIARFDTMSHDALLKIPLLKTELGNTTPVKQIIKLPDRTVFFLLDFTLDCVSGAMAS